MCLENVEGFSLGRCLSCVTEQGALDVKSYSPIPLPHGRQGALPQTQLGHTVYPTRIPLF